jgi:hypothetical protein
VLGEFPERIVVLFEIILDLGMHKEFLFCVRINCQACFVEFSGQKLAKEIPKVKFIGERVCVSLTNAMGERRNGV